MDLEKKKRPQFPQKLKVKDEDPQTEARLNEFWGMNRRAVAGGPRSRIASSVPARMDATTHIVNTANSFTLGRYRYDLDAGKQIKRLKKRLPLDLVEYVGVSAISPYPLDELCQRFFPYIGFLWDDTVYFDEWEKVPHTVSILRERILARLAAGFAKSAKIETPSGGYMHVIAPIDCVRQVLISGYYVNHALDSVGYSGLLAREILREHEPKSEGDSTTKTDGQRQSEASDLENSGEDSAEQPDNMMLYDQSSNTWQLFFKGEKLPNIKNYKGMQYLAHILCRPREGQSTLDLHRAVEKQQVIVSSAVDGISKEAVRDYMRRRSELQGLIDAADDEHNNVLSDQYSKELEQVLKEINKYARHFGGPESYNRNWENIRRTVCNNIMYTLKKLDANSMALARYLRRTIKFGSAITYIPERDIDFEVSF